MATMKQLPDGVYYVQWYDGAGLRQRRRFKDKASAQQQYDAVCGARLFENAGIAQVHSVSSRNFKKMLFQELADRYVNEHLIPLTRSACNEAYIRILAHKWGKYRLSLITRQAFRDWLRHALQNPIWTPGCKDGKLRQLSANSVEHLCTYMQRVFNWGIEKSIISTNPVVKAKDALLLKEFRRRKVRKREVLTVEEFTALVAGWPGYVRNPAIVAYYTGLRRGELCSCKWSQIDRKAMCIHFAADETKEADAKDVYYDPEADAVFERLEIEYIAEGHTDGYVFRNENGKPLTAHSFTSSVRHYCHKHADATGDDRYRKISPHSFRRSYKTRKSIEGMDAKAVAANMGHHSLQTADIYDMVTVERQRSIAGRNQSPVIAPMLDEILNQARVNGMELADIQAQIRRQWTEAVGNFGQSGHTGKAETE